jgi:hypothetical protein
MDVFTLSQANDAAISAACKGMSLARIRERSIALENSPTRVNAAGKLLDSASLIHVAEAMRSSQQFINVFVE